MTAAEEVCAGGGGWLEESPAHRHSPTGRVVLRTRPPLAWRWQWGVCAVVSAEEWQARQRLEVDVTQPSGIAGDQLQKRRCALVVDVSLPAGRGAQPAQRRNNALRGCRGKGVLVLDITVTGRYSYVVVQGVLRAPVL